VLPGHCSVLPVVRSPAAPRPVGVSLRSASEQDVSQSHKRDQVPEFLRPAFDAQRTAAPTRRETQASQRIHSDRVRCKAADVAHDADGVVLGDLLAISTDPGGALVDYPVFTGPSTLGSRITYTVVRSISSAIVIVDPAQVSKLNIGQLVDYVGLVGLAEINLDKDLGEAPSILKVFAASETSPPVEMTAWDRAMLQALYTTPQRSKVQLSQMETATLKLIAAR